MVFETNDYKTTEVLVRSGFSLETDGCFTPLHSRAMSSQCKVLILLIVSITSSHAFSISSSQKDSGLHPRRQSIFPNSNDVTTKHIEVFIRQTGQANAGSAAIGVPTQCACRHNFPQVFTLDPLPNDRRMNSGLLKLSCPLLVRAVDQLEDEGCIAQFNKRVEDSRKLQDAMRDAHKVHAKIRMVLLDTEDQRQALKLRLGDQGADFFLSAGVAGASPEAVSDVKCLHAWLGDYLFRGAEASPLGALVAELLQERGIDIRGTIDCQSYCDPLSSLPAAPPTPRNKQRLKTTKERNRRKNKQGSP